MAAMLEIGRILIFFGLIFLILGVVLMAGVKVPRLPGDIYIEREGSTFIFPIVTSIIISIILSIILNLFLKK